MEFKYYKEEFQVLESQELENNLSKSFKPVA